MNIKFKFIWYDLWVGVYIDVENKTLYVGLLPTLILIIKR